MPPQAKSAVPCVQQWGDACGWGAWGAAATFLLLLAFQTMLVWMARRAVSQSGTDRVVLFMDLIVTGDDNRYSLSRFQVYLWTVISAVAFGAASFASGKFADIPANLYLLMGVNVASSVAATAITTVKGGAQPRPGGRPSFARDLFFESGAAGSLDLPRTQMFIWTMISAVTYVVLFAKQFPGVPGADGRLVLPDVPTGMLALMGISQGTYLGAKAATRSAPSLTLTGPAVLAPAAAGAQLPSVVLTASFRDKEGRPVAGKTLVVTTDRGTLRHSAVGPPPAGSPVRSLNLVTSASVGSVGQASVTLYRRPDDPAGTAMVQVVEPQEGLRESMTVRFQ